MRVFASLAWVTLVALSLFTSPTVASGSLCKNAQVVNPPYNGTVYRGTTAVTSYQSYKCGLESFSQTGAQMYRVNLTAGSQFDVTTCYPFTTFDTMLAIYTGSCDDLSCVATNDNGACEENRDASALSIVADQSGLYWVMITGYRDEDGLYDMSLLETQTPTGCEAAVDLPGPYFSPVTVSGYIPLGDADSPCGVYSNCVGDWYVIHPTKGADVTVTTCGNYTGAADTVLVVLEGTDCDDVLCVAASDDDCPSQRSLSTVDFVALLSPQYYVFVTGIGSFNGSYELTVSETQGYSTSATSTPQPGNSGYGNPTPSPSPGPARPSATKTTNYGNSGISNSPTPTVSVSSSPIKPGAVCGKGEKITGAVDIVRSTEGMMTYTSSCSGQANESPVYWFELDLPAGASVTLSTCSSETDFDTQIGVLENCSDTSCYVFGDDDNNCPVASASYVYFDMESSPVWAFVTGYGGTSGTFEFVVTVN